MKLKLLFLSFIFISLVQSSYAAQFNIANGDIAALKAAITTSNSNSAPDTIHLAQSGVYRFTSVDNTFVDGDNALPVFRKDISDANALTIFANGATLIRDPSIDVLRLLYLIDCKVTIYDINLIGGSTLQYDNSGGAIVLNSARLTIYNSLLKDNKASNGGAVYLATTVANFSAYNCTFTNNTATFGSGSVLVSYDGSTYLKNCTVVNNTCVNTSAPAAIFNYVPLNSNTTTDNVVLQNTIVAANIYNNPASPDNGKEFDLFGATYSQGGNFIGSYPVVMQVLYQTFRQGTPSPQNDYVGTETAPIDPQLGALGENGYFTDSYSLQPGSSAALVGAGTTTSTTPMLASNGIIPYAAYAGDVITITGINLSGITKIQFNGSPTITSGITTTDTTIKVTVPANAQTGKILVMDNVPHFIFTIQDFKLKTITTPAAPANLTATATGASTVSLNWSDAADEDNYQIEYKATQDNNYTVLATIGADTIAYSATQLLCNTSYDFRVFALGRGTQSASSNVATVATSSLQTPSAISGNASVSEGTTETYTITAVAGLSYDWSYSGTDATLSANGNQVEIAFAAGAGSGTLSVTADNSYCNSAAATLALSVGAVTATREATLDEAVTIAPNPSNGKFRIDVPLAIGTYTISISDLNGQTIYRSEAAGQYQVELSSIQKGIYVVMISANEKYVTRKVVLN